MHWIEMLRAQVSPGEEQRLIQSLQELLQASDKPKPPVVAATLWRHATLATDLCVIIYCENSSKGTSPTQSLLGQQVADMMRASGLISIDVWYTPRDESMEVQQ
jgi:hypothetical protein